METQDLQTMIFPGFEKIEPEDLISLSADYRKHSPEVKEFAKKNIGKTKEMHFARINLDGSLTERTIFGTILQVEENYFHWSSNENFDGTKNEKPVNSIMRFENVLGIIPILPSAKGIILYEDDSSEKTRGYFLWLNEARKLMQCYTDTTHAATLHFRYNKEKELFRNGNYKIECSLVTVNHSNVAYNHNRTFAFKNRNERYVDLIPRSNEIDRFIAPDRYLSGVTIVPNRQHQFNYADDE
jgi:hypothetical protein